MELIISSVAFFVLVIVLMIALVGIINVSREFIEVHSSVKERAESERREIIENRIDWILADIINNYTSPKYNNTINKI